MKLIMFTFAALLSIGTSAYAEIWEITQPNEVKCEAKSSSVFDMAVSSIGLGNGTILIKTEDNVIFESQEFALATVNAVVADCNTRLIEAATRGQTLAFIDIPTYQYSPKLFPERRRQQKFIFGDGQQPGTQVQP